MTQEPTEPLVSAAEGVPVQDAVREEQLRQLFGLFPSGEGRSGADAVDESGTRYELKTTTKSGVTTSRDVGRHTLQKWRERVWIAARGRNLPSGFAIDEVYVLLPQDLEAWFAERDQQFALGLNLLGRAIAALREHSFTDSDIDRLTYFVERGITINNPKIPWHYIVAYGTQIEADHPNRLRELVASRLKQR